MPNLNQQDEKMRHVLETARTIAVVGHSDKPYRTSYQIAEYLRGAGYRVFAVNPTIDAVNGEPSYPSLAAIQEPIDIVNVFRRSEHVSGIVDEAININVKAIWTQLGVIDLDAATRAESAGLDVAMNRCIKVEHARLLR